MSLCFLNQPIDRCIRWAYINLARKHSSLHNSSNHLRQLHLTKSIKQCPDVVKEAKVLEKVVPNVTEKSYVITSKVCSCELIRCSFEICFLFFRYHKTSYPSSCSTRWCQTYFWIDLRRSSWCPQNLSWKRYPWCCYIHRTC